MDWKFLSIFFLKQVVPSDSGSSLKILRVLSFY